MASDWCSDVLPHIRWRLEVNEGDEIPDGYGISHYDWYRPVAIAYPLPLNLIVGACRAALHWLRCPPWRFAEYRTQCIKRAAWDEGFDAGHEVHAFYLPATNPYRARLR